MNSRKHAAVSSLVSMLMLSFSCSITMQPALAVDPPTASGSSTTSNSTPTVLDASALNGSGGLSSTAGSTTVIDFANLQNVSLTGNLSNSGNIFFASSNPNVNTVNFSAAGIYNMQGALMGSLLPSYLSGFYPIHNLNLSSSTNLVNNGTISSSGNLNLAAVQQVINTGTISSQANLSIQAASIVNSALLSAMQNINLQAANILNSGQINAALGNINIASALSSNIIINNSGGTMQALNGLVNVRDSLYSGIADLNIDGGKIIAQALNLNNGNGKIQAHLDSIEGLVNARGNCA
ncbi:MAG: hypothetical protein K2X27_19760, partial [Candidatus Obscuribacterales bacterium]|nr:hypothetical protein [Candidatus Obscuribacterales bacterium]